MRWRCLLRARARSPTRRAADGARAGHLAVENHAARPHGRAICWPMFMRGGGDPDTRQPDGDPVLMQFILDRDAAGLR